MIDPGRAFGTGAHPTTRLALELLGELEPGSLLDVGCGSGVLAIAAAKLGFGPVVALDNDDTAVETTPANAVANGVAVDARVADALADPLPAAEIAVANVTLAVVEQLAPRLDVRLFVASGYLERDEPVLDGWERRDRRTADGWAADLFERALAVYDPPVATFSVRFLGCKVSHVDAHDVRERLLADGHAERDGGADVAVVNTCCVTHEAVSKSRKEAARAARTHRRVYVTGCGANLAADAFAGSAGERRRGRAAERADARLDRRRRRRDRLRPGRRAPRPRPRLRQGAGRLLLLVPFCVIPLVRGSSRSRAADAVLAEIRRRVGQGHREVVLTGINLGCYRDRAAGYDLPRLVREAGATPGLERLRLSSIEINHVSDALVAALRETPTVSRHLHVPLQSGDDGVLRAMGRRYSAGTYLRRLAPLQDEFNLTSDVIVGFPAEDERAFANTLGTAREAGLTKIHVFPYSPRPGTVTAGEDAVPPQVKRERGARLRAASHEACLARWRTKVGRDDLVLVDRPGRGYGDDYSPWLVGGDAPVGALVPVRGAAVSEEGILAA